MESAKLPLGWVWTKMGDITEVNPRMSFPQHLSSESFASFVPMSAVDEEQGAISEQQKRPIQEVWKGYTRFQDGDVLFAKITPCMENGKAAIAHNLENGIGLGSTEFHVLRPTNVVTKDWIYHFIRQSDFRKEAHAEMTGTAGQLRVPASFLKDYPIPLPPLSEQERIVEAIEAQLSRIEAGVASVRNAQNALRRYKASVLNAACTGQLLPQDPTNEPAALLLERILAERRERWEAEQREKYAAQGKPLPKGWQDKYPAPAAPDTTDLPDLPEGWVWASVEQISFLDVGFAFKSNEFTDAGIRLLRGDNIEPGSLRWIDTKYWATDKIDPYKHLLLNSREIILAMDRPLISTGLKIARVHPSDLPCLLVQRMARFRLIQKTVEDYLYLSLQINSFINHLVSGQTGTQLPHISSRNINEYTFPLPPLAEQSRIVAEMERRLSVVAALEQTVTATLQRAARLRQSVLRKAFRGELVEQDPNDEPAEALLESC